MRHELVPAPQYDLGVIQAALDGDYVVGLHAMLLFEHLLHLVEVAVLHHVHLEFGLELEWVVRVRLVEFGLIIVDLLVCLIEEVVEFLLQGKQQSPYISELVGLLASFLGNVVAVPKHGLLVWLAGGLTRDVERAGGPIHAAELYIGHRGSRIGVTGVRRVPASSLTCLGGRLGLGRARGVIGRRGLRL